ncbi:MAG TPA: hypothetical protein VGE45_04595 [Chloroflexia bacterium]
MNDTGQHARFLHGRAEVIAFVVILFTAGCDLPFVQKSPEQELREELSNDPEIRSYQIEGSKPLVGGNNSGGGIVVYSAYRRTGEYVRGHLVVGPIKNGVRASGGGRHVADPNIPASAVFCYTVLAGGGTPGYVAVIGRADPQDVASIEVSYSNGETAKEEMKGGTVIIVMPGASDPTSIRAIGHAGEILHEAKPDSVPPLRPNEMMSDPEECTP